MPAPREIELDGITYTVKCDWEDDGLGGFEIEGISVNGSPDLYEVLTDKTIEKIIEKVLENLKEN